jgi:hypothetical protein
MCPVQSVTNVPVHSPLRSFFSDYLFFAQEVADASSWRWSSAGVHCAAVEEDNLVAMATWQDHWSTGGWREFLATEQPEAEWLDIRRCTYTGRPLGTADFVRALEQRTHRTLAPRKGGRPRKSNLKADQGKLAMAG